MAIPSATMELIDTRPQWFRATQPFLLGGGVACFATAVVQPIDMIKVRIQLATEGGKDAVKSPLRVASNIIKNEGFFKLYKGLDAGLLRQLTYSTARLGLFRVISDAMLMPGETKLPLYKKAVAGLAAGGLAALIGNPADLSLIRLQADATLPVEQRRNYTGALNAMTRIVREEGVLALWRGSTPTIARAMALNMGMLAAFDQAKELLTPAMGTGTACTLAASAVSGFFAVTFSLPFDYMKTRIQKARPDPVTGKMPYRGLLDCALQTIRQGPMTFYTGYLTYYVRIAPHAMITLILLDWANKLVKDHYFVPAVQTLGAVGAKTY